MNLQLKIDQHEGVAEAVVDDLIEVKAKRNHNTYTFSGLHKIECDTLRSKLRIVIRELLDVPEVEQEED